MAAAQPNTFRPIERVAEMNVKEIKNILANDRCIMDWFIQRFGNELRYVPEWGQWCVWNGSHWDRGENENQVHRRFNLMVTELAEAVNKAELDDETNSKFTEKLGKLCSNSRLGTFMVRLKTHPDVITHQDEFDRSSLKLACANGNTLHLWKKKQAWVQESNPTDYITKCTNAEYDKDAECPRFEKFMLEIFDGDEGVVEYMQRFLGTCLSGEVLPVFSMFYGEGRNGKSVLVETIAYVLGEYAALGDTDLLVEQFNNPHPEMVAMLQGRRFVYCDEPPKNRRLHVQRIKQITGGSSLRARYMRCNSFEFPNTAKIAMMTNHKLRIEDDSVAFSERLRLIPFEVSFLQDGDNKPDVNLAKKLKKEAAGILNWMIEGWIDYKEGGLRPPKKVMDESVKYFEEEDTFGGFMREFLDFTGEPDDYITAKDLRDRLADEYGIERWTNEFTRRLEKAGAWRPKNPIKYRNERGAWKNVKGWLGVLWKYRTESTSEGLNKLQRGKNRKKKRK